MPSSLTSNSKLFLEKNWSEKDARLTDCGFINGVACTMFADQSIFNHEDRKLSSDSKEAPETHDACPVVPKVSNDIVAASHASGLQAPPPKTRRTTGAQRSVEASSGNAIQGSKGAA